MAKKRFIAAFSPDAGEVAAEVSPSSSAGPIRRRRSPDPPAAAPLRRFEDFPVLLLGNVVISKKFLRTRKIMVMHSNERGECGVCGGGQGGV